MTTKGKLEKRNLISIDNNVTTTNVKAKLINRWRITSRGYVAIKTKQLIQILIS